VGLDREGGGIVSVATERIRGQEATDSTTKGRTIKPDMPVVSPRNNLHGCTSRRGL
jgi:hypothetical protein